MFLFLIVVVTRPCLNGKQMSFTPKSLGPICTVNSGSWFSWKLKIFVQACLPQYKEPSHPWLPQSNDIHSPKTPFVISKMNTGTEYCWFLISSWECTLLFLVLFLRLINSDGFCEPYVVFVTGYREFRLNFNPSVTGALQTSLVCH